MSKADDFADILDDVLGDFESDGNKVPGYLNTGLPELNRILSGDALDGGMPMSRMIEIFGPASSGKTFLSTMVMASAQKLDGIAFFADHERTFDPMLAAELGMDVEDKRKFRWLKPTTFEESIDLCVVTAKKLRRAGLTMDRPIVWVFDSVASMVPHSKYYDANGKERAVGDYNMRDKLALASATSQSYPQLAQIAADYNVTVLLLNQIRVDPAQMFGDPTTTPGGKAAEFYCSIRLSLGKKDLYEGTGKDKEVVGTQVTAKTTKNKVTRPHLKTSWKVAFTDEETRVDYIGANLEFLVSQGIVEKNGNRIKWDGKSLYQSQVEAELRSMPNGNDVLMNMLREHKGSISEVVEESSLEDVLASVGAE